MYNPFNTQFFVHTGKKVYGIKCRLVKYMEEYVKDWHLVVQDLTIDEMMVVEVKKTPRVPPPGTKLQITGVGFFDKSNHPTGFKGRELHLVPELQVL